MLVKYAFTNTTCVNHSYSAVGSSVLDLRRCYGKKQNLQTIQYRENDDSFKNVSKYYKRTVLPTYASLLLK